MQRFHENAKKWINSKTFSANDRQKLMEEDLQHPYSNFPITYPDLPNSSGTNQDDLEYGEQQIPEYSYEVTT